MRLAYQTCGGLMDEIGHHLVSSWEIQKDYVGGQINPDLSPGESRRTLLELATRFGLTYVEEENGRVRKTTASSDGYGVHVQLWTVHTTQEVPK